MWFASRHDAPNRMGCRGRHDCAVDRRDGDGDRDTAKDGGQRLRRAAMDRSRAGWSTAVTLTCPGRTVNDAWRSLLIARARFTRTSVAWLACAALLGLGASPAAAQRLVETVDPAILDGSAQSALDDAL
jgi:hypothetical protein